jgi:hypothetical protein
MGGAGPRFGNGDGADALGELTGTGLRSKLHAYTVRCRVLVTAAQPWTSFWWVSCGEWQMVVEGGAVWRGRIGQTILYSTDAHRGEPWELEQRPVVLNQCPLNLF